MWCLYELVLVIATAVKVVFRKQKEICQQGCFELWGTHYPTQDGFNNKEFMIPLNKASGGRAAPELVHSGSASRRIRFCLPVCLKPWLGPS